MAEEKEQFEQRTVKLNHSKKKTGEEVQPLTEPGTCGSWYIKIMGGHTYTCRKCLVGSPTLYEIEECVQLPD